ncbi:MAG TPA: Vms1/Ankzf1 family peptidyl-tRNA hydrolase [Thermodesulfobacteriota bacterium]|nr:Vms1/Ankzf1 family peptidyl-tRNA hydrolase [Thermodesulfobacteriota bacterium]
MAISAPFQDDLRALMDRPLLPAERVISCYLDASVNEEGQRTFEPFFEARVRQARRVVAGLPADLEGYDALVERMRAFVRETDWSGVLGLACFAEIPPAGGPPGGEAPFARFLRLPVRVENRFVLGREPDLGPLLRALASHEHYLVVRFDADDARILSVYLARVVAAETERAEGPAEEVPGRIRAKPGGWAQMRFQRRKREHVRHWFRDLAGRLARLAARERPAGLVLLGQAINVAALREELPEWLEARVIAAGTVEPHASDAELLARVTPLVESVRGAETARLVDELYDRVLRDFFAAGGVEATLEALQAGKVETLVVSRRFDADGGRCERCGFLVAARHPSCPYCGGPLARVPLLQHLIRKAEEQDAAVHVVEPGDRRLDEDLEGVGALLRF